MRTSCLLVSTFLLGAVGLAGPARATGNTCPGDPGYVLTLPETVTIGQSFTTCIEAPAGSVAFVLVSGESGMLQTPYGPLCLGLPLLTIWPVVLPAGGVLCLDHAVPCDYPVDGVTAHFQFAAVGPGAGQVGLSNSASLMDKGFCIAPGNFYTFTQGGWGTQCSGNNPGCFRDANFAGAFPLGLILGDQDGDDDDGHSALVLTSSLAVEKFLPSGSTAGALDADHVNPTGKTSAGVFAGQLAAAKLNVGFDDAGSFDALKGQVDMKLGDLVYASGVHPALLGKSVRDVVALCDQAISGELAEPFDVDADLLGDVLFSDLNTALTVLNENFDDGTTNGGHLKLP